MWTLFRITFLQWQSTNRLASRDFDTFCSFAWGRHWRAMLNNDVTDRSVSSFKKRHNNACSRQCRCDLWHVNWQHHQSDQSKDMHSHPHGNFGWIAAVYRRDTSEACRLLLRSETTIKSFGSASRDHNAFPADRTCHGARPVHAWSGRLAMSEKKEQSPVDGLLSVGVGRSLWQPSPRASIGTCMYTWTSMCLVFVNVPRDKRVSTGGQSLTITRSLYVGLRFDRRPTTDGRPDCSNIRSKEQAFIFI